MDKTEFIKEVWLKTRINYNAALLEALAQHRKNTLHALSATPRGMDLLHLAALSQLAYSGNLSSSQLTSLEGLEAGFNERLVKWKQLTDHLINNLNQVPRKDLGIFRHFIPQ